MQAVDIVIGAGWAVFWLYWLAASLGVKAGRTQWTRFVGVRVAIVLVALLLLGLALAVWARVYLGRNWGMPMSEKADPELVTTGPYRTVRHPIYSGIILAMIGTTIAVSLYWLVAAVLVGTYFIYSAAMEERYMAGRFPDTYPKYKQSTKMLIPFIF